MSACAGRGRGLRGACSRAGRGSGGHHGRGASNACPPCSTRVPAALPRHCGLPRALSRASLPAPRARCKPAPSPADHTTQSAATHRDPPMRTHSDPLWAPRSTATSAPRPRTRPSPRGEQVHTSAGWARRLRHGPFVWNGRCSAAAHCRQRAPPDLHARCVCKGLR